MGGGERFAAWVSSSRGPHRLQRSNFGSEKSLWVGFIEPPDVQGEHSWESCDCGRGSKTHGSARF